MTVSALVATPGIATASCQLHEVAEFQASMYSGRPTISGKINGVPVKILVDTGSASTSVALATAKLLALKGREGKVTNAEQKEEVAKATKDAQAELDRPRAPEP